MKKPGVTLYIDTTDSQKTVIAIVRDGNRQEFVEKTDLRTKSQNILSLIEKALQQLHLKLTDVTAIKVNIGPGSFTGTRVGISVANALAWGLHVSVNGQKQVFPTYSPSKFDS